MTDSPSDLRFIYIGGGVMIGLLLVLVILIARGIGRPVIVARPPSGGETEPTGARTPEAQLNWIEWLWAKLYGYRTQALVIGYVALRWATRQEIIDQKTFDDIEYFILGGGALTLLSKLNRQEAKLDATSETVKVAASAAKVAAVKTDELIKQGGSDGTSVPKS